MLLQAFCQRLNVCGMIEIGRQTADCGLPAHGLQGIETLVQRRCRGGSAVLRIERHKQDPVAALRLEGLNARGHRRQAIAHGPVNNDLRPVLERLLKLFTLPARDGLQRRFIEGLVPDFFIGLAALLRTERQDNPVQDEPP